MNDILPTPSANNFKGLFVVERDGKGPLNETVAPRIIFIFFLLVSTHLFPPPFASSPPTPASRLREASTFLTEPPLRRLFLEARGRHFSLSVSCHLHDCISPSPISVFLHLTLTDRLQAIFSLENRVKKKEDVVKELDSV